MLNQTAFDLLRNVLREGWGLPLKYFPDLDADLSELDLGIRLHMEDSQRLYAQIRVVAAKLEFGKILLVRDAFRLDNILLKAAPDQPGFYAIGPFRWQPPDDAEFRQATAKWGLNQAQSDAVNYLFRRVPIHISRSVGLAVAKNILLSAYGIEDPEVLELSFEYAGAPETAPLENINDRARRVEETYRHEGLLLSYIAEGNEGKALQEAQFFFHTGMDQRLRNRLFSRRSLAYIVNTLFRKAAEGVGVHPLFLDEISERFARKLEICSTDQQIEGLNIQMIHEYCALCRNQATKGYSANTQKVMQYIQVNLSQNLTPETIAQGVSFSPGYISRRFKEEVGVSLGSYITSRRVEVACQLLEKTTMTVREISSYVGIPDWNYFTKLFRKEKGCTPSQYRKKTVHPEKISS